MWQHNVYYVCVTFSVVRYVGLTTSVHPSIHPPTHPSVHPSVHLSVLSFLCLFVSLLRRYISSRAHAASF